jgi:uncharacterized protein YbcI
MRAESGERPPSPDDPGSELTERDWGDAVADPQGPGSMHAALSNAMVGLKKRYYGKGPNRAKTYINDNYVFVVLEGALTRNEQTLIEAGEEMLVREYRLRFQQVMTKTTSEAVEEITGRRVVGYHSQIIFDPDIGFEFFVLDAAP